MIRIAICDDMELYRERLCELCREFMGREMVDISCFSSGEELLETDENYDVLFLDIKMREIDGIQVKKSYEQQGKNTIIIFLTSHQDRMREAFGKNVYDFLTKPVQIDQFKTAINKVLLQKNGKVLEVKEFGKKYTIQVDKIQYIETQDKYTYVKLDSEGVLFRKTLKEWEKLLAGEDVCKISRYCLLHLRLYERKKKEYVLDSGRRIRVGSNYKMTLQEKYKNYMRKRIEL